MDASVDVIKISIADDHKIFREGFKSLLKKNRKYHIVSEAINGRELIKQVDRKIPDIVFTDLNMPEIDGIEAAKTILSRHPEVKIIGLSVFEDQTAAIQMIKAGCRGYLLKSVEEVEIFTAIDAVCSGELYFSNTIAISLFKLLKRSKFNPISITENPFISEKELQIISYICEELTNKEIAAKMNLSKRTIEEYRLRLLHKTGAKNMVGIVIYSLKNNLIKIQ